MKIRIVVTVDVDPDAWDQEYHCGTGRSDLRADVVQYFDNAIRSIADPDAMAGVRSVSVRSDGKDSR